MVTWPIYRHSPPNTHTPFPYIGAVLHTVGAWSSLALAWPKSICLLTTVCEGVKKSIRGCSCGLNNKTTEQSISGHPGMSTACPYCHSRGVLCSHKSNLFRGQVLVDCFLLDAGVPHVELQNLFSQGLPSESQVASTTPIYLTTLYPPLTQFPLPSTLAS